MDQIMQKDCQTHQMEIDIRENLIADEIKHLQQLNEIHGKNHCQQSMQSVRYQKASSLLKMISEALQTELAVYPDDLPTSFVAVEREIARCISGCLADVSGPSRDTSHIQSLLRDYKVVVPVLHGNHTVSLERVHLILQDNFEGSLLCKLFNILLAGFMNTQTKVICF